MLIKRKNDATKPGMKIKVNVKQITKIKKKGKQLQSG